MSIPKPTTLTTALLAFGLAACAVTVRAQEIIPPGPTGRGAILIYGNFCGPGNRGPGFRPIDALDQACARHDICSADPMSGTLTSCACNRRLTVEAGVVARDPRAPAHTREAARFISDFSAALPCQ
ncbi:hypothetical protein MCBMB27_03031 [Methylobacterium phyllosphaerae]|uniref:Uncharacterized protein n=1 Tax=Methylobacterium phyllosphaerae TaxID=418223 RepID=A0AAE8L519_9HYPH|nr:MULTISPECIES: hypothetical protein [Methylobacterium]APT32322.1 hypothetical protein MCBMB27_03031 [Methylobacterium phyllosphaerae]AWV16432.1 hypothetical protein A3862_13720 [Methylobacterium sp. XJLW]SFG39937.1 hypothetical protein SAMN05192567_10330 [Methylobacterium phyllosphaerae]